MAEKFWTWLAWHLPRSLVYWAVIRAAVKSPEGDTYPGERTATNILKAW